MVWNAVSYAILHKRAKGVLADWNRGAWEQQKCVLFLLGKAFMGCDPSKWSNFSRWGVGEVKKVVRVGKIGEFIFWCSLIVLTDDTLIFDL